MNDPFDRATSTPPPTVGEGCTARYDPEALNEADGTDFPGAERLWETLNEPPAVEKGAPVAAPETRSS
ncbi:hypothetical protein [Pseudomonas sp. RIT-PI-S]|uniref:hypothetical protein n=1 Tax=Pseudomonas sp. RIT-PI-S TaxID=3035295 RepID=UPI0021D895E1|nr:hypothetical protein [Pseudomonas sp. RIT-PI-S]